MQGAFYCTSTGRNIGIISIIDNAYRKNKMGQATARIPHDHSCHCSLHGTAAGDS